MDLVTGGTGLVGSHLIFSLLKKGEKVRALKRRSSDLTWIGRMFHYYDPEFGATGLDKIEWMDVDINDVEGLEEAFEGVDRVFHTAGKISFDPGERKELFRVNRDGTRNMVNLALSYKVSLFSYVSSVITLGNQYKEGVYYVNEEEEWKNTGDKPDYGVSKFFGEMEVWRAAEEGLPVSIVNPSIIIGPGNWEKGSDAFFRRIYRGLPFYPGGSTGFVDVRDVVKIILSLTEQHITGERFLLSSENLAYREAFSIIAHCFGKPAPRIPLSRMMGFIGSMVDGVVSTFSRKPREITRLFVKSGERKVIYDTSKIEQRLNYKFIPFQEAVENTVSFYKQMVLDPPGLKTKV